MAKAGRRQNGEGTIKLRKDGRYEAQITVGRDSDGKLKRKSIFGKSMADVVEKKNAMLNQVQNGSYTETNRMTLQQWLEQWLTVYQEGNISNNFYYRRRDLVRLHINPAIGSIPLQKLKPINIQSFYKQLAKNGRKPRKKKNGETIPFKEGTDPGLATGTIRHIHNILNPALKQAVREGLISKNPAADVTPPRIVKTREAKPLNKDQAGRYLEILKDNRLYAAFVVELTSALRRGELLGLQWEDLDMNTGVLKVRRQVNRIKQKDGSTVLDYAVLKTPAAYRTIILPAVTLAELKSHKARQAQEKLLLGKAYNDEGLMFCTPKGDKLDTRYLYRVHCKTLETAGIEHAAFHDLRHSVATLLLQAGESIKTVQEMLGHANAETTMNCYAHVLEEMRYSAADKLESIFKEVLPVVEKEIPDTSPESVNF
ncbi:MAG TPA: tyrosine-type recombinase/integrase [Syntrophomonadaceae bacterium]|nr:site-specific integrase [Syntrophomonadaceae bacterium]HPF44452.1 tyrosine-type recombinase/integrase [Syntrophomonadaceae bacterium]